MRSLFRFLIGVVLVGVVFGGEPRGHVPVSIWSMTLKGYARERTKEGFAPETYALSMGGKVDGTEETNLGREQIGRLAITVLAQQGYVMAEDSKSADLLIVVAWGKTMAPTDLGVSQSITEAGQVAATVKALDAKVSESAVEQAAYDRGALVAAQTEQAAGLQTMFMLQEMQQRSYAANARLLGYDHDLRFAEDIAHRSPYNFHQRNRRDELAEEVVDPRYYIVVTAYDFRAAVERGEKVPRWVTRISIRARGNDFSERVAEMLGRGGKYFGVNSKRLLRRFKGEVEIGEATVVESDVGGGEATEQDAAAPPRP